MSEPFVGEIRMFCRKTSAQGWHSAMASCWPSPERCTVLPCWGRSTAATARTTSARSGICAASLFMGSGLACRRGSLAPTVEIETVTLTVNSFPPHSHALNGTGAVATANSPAGNVPARQHH